jgi:hypothetical protein
MAAVLLGVVEPWLSPGAPIRQDWRLRFGRTNLRAPAKRSPAHIDGSQDPAPLVFQREYAGLLLQTIDDVLASIGH